MRGVSTETADALRPYIGTSVTSFDPARVEAVTGCKISLLWSWSSDKQNAPFLLFLDYARNASAVSVQTPRGISANEEQDI